MTRRFITLGVTLALTAPAFAQDLTQQARDLAQQARAAYPKNAWHIDQPLWQRAAQAAERAVEATPNDPAALQLRAQVYTDVGFWSRAEGAWNAYFQAGGQGDEARRGAADTQYNLGFTAYRRGQFTEARNAFARCLEYNPQARCAAWAGRVELESGNLAAAADFYARAAQLDPNDQSHQYFQALAQRANTFGADATSAFTRGYRAFEAGDKQAALTAFQEAARLAPQFTEAQRFVGRLALELGQGPLARQAWEAVAQQSDATAGDRYNLELAREVERYGKDAVKAYRDAYSQYAKGDKALAEQGFLTATNLNPEYQKAWSWLGRVRYERGDYAGAADAYGRAVQLDPNDKASAYYLRLAQQRR